MSGGMLTGGVTDASEAFDRLGDETRMAVLEALVGEDGRPVERTFTELFEATDEETSAGFAYHLRQLRGHFVERTDDGYRLTYAGRQVVRAIAAGTYTESVAHEGVDVPDDCPLCGENALRATGADNVLTVGCDACDRDVLSLPFPPGGHATQSDLLAAFDAHHRHRIGLLTDGACPECGGAVETRVAVASADGAAASTEGADPSGDGADATDDGTDPEPGPARAELACQGCGYGLRVPVTLTVRSHPAAVALYHEAGEDVRDRPLWNVGPEWTETVVSADPVCVEVATRVGGERLSLLVGADGTVAHVDRTSIEAVVDDGTGEEEAEAGADGATA